MKRIISLFLICSLLIVAIPHTTEQASATVLSVDEILDNYCQQVFESHLTSQSEELSPYSRSTGSNKTLAQETVEILTESGYEAYNVTAENYDALEASLQTVLSSLGIERNGSYIIVFENEYPDSGSNSNSRALDPITPVPGGSDGGTGFYYTYDGTDYLMRGVTVTANDTSLLSARKSCTISEIMEETNYVGDILDALCSIGIDALCKGLPVSTVLSLLAEWSTNDAYSVQSPGEMRLTTMTTWRRKYIQVWDEARPAWFTAQGSCSAVSSAHITGYVVNSITAEPEWVDSGEQKATFYSDFYNDPSVRYTRAAIGFIQKATYMDYTGDINFNLLDENGVSITTDGTPLFTHKEPLTNIIPEYQEN